MNAPASAAASGQAFDYLAPVIEGEAVDIATWIAENDGRLRLARAYDMRRPDGARVFRRRTIFVSVDMKTGKPARLPAEFVAAYKPAG
jgi:acyl-CoA thioester hydrolase